MRKENVAQQCRSKSFGIELKKAVWLLPVAKLKHQRLQRARAITTEACLVRNATIVPVRVEGGADQ